MGTQLACLAESLVAAGHRAFKRALGRMNRNMLSQVLGQAKRFPANEALVLLNLGVRCRVARKGKVCGVLVEASKDLARKYFS